jgi:hypothetical protein
VEATKSPTNPTDPIDPTNLIMGMAARITREAALLGQVARKTIQRTRHG